MKIIIIIIWLICSFITYGTLFAYFQGEFPTIAKEKYRQNMSLSMFFSLFGPAGIIVSIPMSGFWEYGFKLY